MSNITCVNCGILFSMPDQFEQARRDDHKSWYCPSGHMQYFPGKTDAEKQIDNLHAELATATDRADEWQINYEDEYDAHLITRRKLAAARGMLTKARKRIAQLEDAAQ